MRIMRLQLASEKDLKHYPNTIQGRGDLERDHAVNQQDGRPRHKDQDRGSQYNLNEGDAATGGGGKWNPSKSQLPCPLKDETTRQLTENYF